MFPGPWILLLRCSYRLYCAEVSYVAKMCQRKEADSLIDAFEKLVLTADKTCISEIWVNGADSIKRQNAAQS